MSCDHKFVDSPRCLKCGWEPPPRRDPNAPPLPTAPPDYRIVWNGEEYIASRVPQAFDVGGDSVTGHSRHPGSAFVALLNRLMNRGIPVLPEPPCDNSES